MIDSGKAYVAPTLDSLSLHATSDELQPVGPPTHEGSGLGVYFNIGVDLGLPGLGS